MWSNQMGRKAIFTILLMLIMVFVIPVYAQEFPKEGTKWKVQGEVKETYGVSTQVWKFQGEITYIGGQYNDIEGDAKGTYSFETQFVAGCNGQGSTPDNFTLFGSLYKDDNEKLVLHLFISDLFEGKLQGQTYWKFQCGLLAFEWQRDAFPTLPQGFDEIPLDEYSNGKPLVKESCIPDGFYCVREEISLEGSVEFLIKGKVTDKSGHPLPNSIVVLQEFEKMPKLDKITLKKLSESKPDFKEKTVTDDDGSYKFKVDVPEGKLPKMMIASLLWYDGDNFAVTDQTEVDGRRVPLYQALCVDLDDLLCVKYEKSNEIDGLEAKADFIYGSESNFEKHWLVMKMEDWDPAGAKDIPTLMEDAGVVYYNSYKAIKYLKDVGIISLEPVTIQIRNTKDETCKKNPQSAFYDDEETTPFGDLGSPLDNIPATGGSVVLCDKDSEASYPDAPKNREYHELGHYFQHEMYKPQKIEPILEENHGGYANNYTYDSVAEGFAEFVSMLISERYGDNPQPAYMYPVDTDVVNLEEDYKVWGRSRVIYSSPNATNSTNTTPPPIIYEGLDDEEYAVAGILWDLYDDDSKDPAGVLDKHTGLSKVYSQTFDEVSLSAKDILETIHDKKPPSILTLYNAFATVHGIDDIFINHGAFNDTIVRNFVHDYGEKIGPTGDPRPWRINRESPKPRIAGSYLMPTANGTIKIEKIYKEPYNYSYSYLINVTANKPVYFSMPSYPAKMVISQVLEEGASKVTEIDSEEYWQYIESKPAKDAIFKTIPLVEVPLISFAPASSVNDTIGAARTFNITVDQIVNVTWYINGTEVFNQTNITESSYTNTSTAQGIWNVSAVAANANGSAMQTWIWNVTATIPSVRFITDKNTYIQREQVTFTIINNGTITIDLPSSAPWWVKNATGERIFSPIALAVIIPLEPGQSISWTWDQNDNKGQQVPPGTYQGVIKTSIGNSSTQDFEITLSSALRGDINKNGRRDTGDATLILRNIVGLSIPPQYTPILPAGDMNCNGRIDTGDATLILRDVVGLPIPRC